MQRAFVTLLLAVLVPAALVPAVAFGKGALSLSEIATLGKFVDCTELCPPLPAKPTYEQHLRRQTCLAACGEPPRTWEKNGVAPVDRVDLDLAFIEYQHHTPGNATPQICYTDADQTLVSPAALCASPVCQQVTPCTTAECLLPTQSQPTCQNVAGTYVCMWPNGRRPARCPDIVCGLKPTRSASNCVDNDHDLLPKWLDDGLLASGGALGDTVADSLCSAAAPCRFNQVCRYDGSRPGGVCKPRACPPGGCTAFHLELVAEDDTQAIFHVFYDWSPLPARVLDLPVVYDEASLELLSARLLPTVTLFHKDFAAQHLSDGTLRLTLYDAGSSEPIPFGPIVELVFSRVGDGAATVGFSKNDALQLAALAPVQGSQSGPQQDLANDALWGAAVALKPRKDVPTRLRYWLSMDDLNAPFAYRNVQTAEQLCERWPACINDKDPASLARTLAQLDALQAGQLVATRTVDGVAGAAAVLDGRQDHLRLPVHFDEPLVSSAQNLSFSAWFLPEGNAPGSSGDQVLFSHNAFNERTAISVLVRPTSGGVADVLLVTGDLLSPTSVTRAPIATGVLLRTWHHIAFALDAASGQATVWFDGVAVPPITLPASSGPDFVKCPQFPNTVDVVQAYEGGVKGNLNGSAPPEALYFGAVEGVRPTVDSMTASGLERRTLLSSNDAGFRDVDYSPAVDRLVYASDATGGWEIWTSHADGTEPKQVTTGFGSAKRGFRARRARWSPDGSAIAFESNAFDVMRQDNTYRRVYHVYVVRFDRDEDQVAVTLPDGTVLTQLDYAARVGDGTIRAFRVTDSSVDRHTMNARWLAPPTATSGGTLVADRADVDFKGHQVVRLALTQPLASTPSTVIADLTGVGESEPRLIAARRYVGFSTTGQPTSSEYLFYDAIAPGGKHRQYLAEVSTPTVSRRLLQNGDTLGVYEDGALSPELDVASQLPNLVLAATPPQGRPLLLRTVTPATTAGARSLTDQPTRVRGLSWVRRPRLYPCQWAGGFQHPAAKVQTLGFRGALDDLRVFSGLRDPDAVRSEYERGLAVLTRDQKTTVQPPLFDATCTGHTDCARSEVCVRPPAGAAGTCQVVSCDPTIQYPCPSGGQCRPAPPGVTSSTGHICASDCDSDSDCFAQQCANGICRFCDAGACSECRTTTVGTTSATVGCPDEKSFACNGQGACTTQCYAFDDGASRYLCDPATQFCQSGQCVNHQWSWWDFAPAGFGGLGEMRRDVPPQPQLFERYRMAVDQRAVLKLQAYGVEDFEEEPEVLIEVKGGIFYGATWSEIGRVTVVARTPSEAAIAPIVVTAWPFESVRLRLVVPPYNNPSAGATGFDAGKDTPFCPDDSTAPNAPAGQSASCRQRPPGSAAHLGYGPVTRWQGIAECNARDRSGCPGFDAQNAYAFLRGGYPAVAVVDLAVNGNRVPPSLNQVCSYGGGTVPTEPSGAPRRLWFGDYGFKPEQSASATVACAGGCPPVAGGKFGLATFNVTQAGYALLNCPWNAPGQPMAAVTYNGPIIYNSDLTQPVGDILRDDGEICTVEAGASLEPCYDLAGQDASCDPGNTAVDVGASTPFNTLDFATFRFFGHDQGFSAVPLPRANLTVSVTSLAAGATLAVRVAGKTLTFTGPGSQVAALLKKGARYTASVTKQPAVPNHRCFVQGPASGNMTAAGATVNVACETLRTVGGQVQGLDAARLVLRMTHSGVAPADTDEFEVLGAGAAAVPFVFGAALPAGQAYAVSIFRQPEGKQCAIAAGPSTGSVGALNVTAIMISCQPVQLQPLSVSVSGLLGGGLRLVDRATQTYLNVSANGPTTFSVKRAPGSTYDLLIVAHPQNPAQVCQLGAGAAGAVGYQPLSVPVTCTTLPTFPVGGVAYGVIGTGLTLGLNIAGVTAATEVVTATSPPGGAVAVSFQAPVAVGQSYAVTVLAQPVAPEQLCTVTAGSGTIESAAPIAFAVTCLPKPSEKSFTVGGAVAGLQGTGLRLVLTGGVQKLEITTNGPFTFPTPLLDGNDYAVTVAKQPNGPTQRCTVTGGKGTVQGTNVTGVAIACVDAGLVAVTLTNLAQLEGASVRAFLYTTQAPVKLVGVAPSGTTIEAGQATFNVKLNETVQPGQPEPDALLPAGVYGLVVLINADGSTDTASGAPLFNAGDDGTFAQVAVAVRQVNTVTLAGTKDLQKGRVSLLVPVVGRLTCYWAPSGMKALPLPPNPKIHPIFATTTQCGQASCASDDPLKKVMDEGVLFGAPGLVFDVTCWLDVDESGSVSTGDSYGTKLGVTATNPVLVLDQTK